METIHEKIRLEKQVNCQNCIKLNNKFINNHYPRTNFMCKKCKLCMCKECYKTHIEKLIYQ